MRLPARDERPAVDDDLDAPETTRWKRTAGERVWAAAFESSSMLAATCPAMLVVAHAREGHHPASDLKTWATKAEELASDNCGADTRSMRADKYSAHLFDTQNQNTFEEKK